MEYLQFTQKDMENIIKVIIIDDQIVIIISVKKV